MRTTISKFKYVLILAVITAFVSCKGDIGPAGPAGTDGTNGVDGTNGTDGNANVQTYIFNNPAWGTASGMTIDMTGIFTDSVIANDAILVYVKHSSQGLINAIPGLVFNGNYRNYSVFTEVADLLVVSLETDGSFTPNANLWAMDWLKVVIIESTNVTNDGAKSFDSKQEILYNLDKAGVDINNYYQVMYYFGLEY